MKTLSLTKCLSWLCITLSSGRVVKFCHNIRAMCHQFADFVLFFHILVTVVALCHGRETECRPSDSDSDVECSDSEGKIALELHNTR